MAQITTAELATELGTDARTARKFLRADARANGQAIPGKGARWSIERREVRSLKSRFAKWEQAQSEARAEREAKLSEAPIVEVEDSPNEIEDSGNDSLDALEGPSDAELLEIED